MSDVLTNAKADAITFSEFVNTDDVSVPRRAAGDIRTLAGINALFDSAQAGEFVAASEAAADRAETASEIAMTAGGVYPNVAAGEADRVDGDYFWVVSADSNEVLELWLMGASSATDAGKRTVSRDAVILKSDYQGSVGSVGVGGGAFNSAGSVVSNSNYKRTSALVAKLFRCNPDLADYYYTGEIADAGYAGVIYKDELNNVLGFDCDSVQVYSRYKLSPPAGTYWIAACSLNAAQLLIEFQSRINAGKTSLSEIKRVGSDLAKPFEIITPNTANGFAINRELVGISTSADAQDYQRTSLITASSMVLIDPSYQYFYTGEINDLSYIGVAYLDSSLNYVGNDCVDLTAYNRYELTPPDNAMYIAGCSLIANPLVIERRLINYDYIAEAAAKVPSIEVSANLFNANFVSTKIGDIATGVGALAKPSASIVVSASDYLRTSITSTSSLFTVVSDKAQHYYTGEIDNGSYAGVFYLDVSFSVIGFECDSVQVYDNYPLDLPEGTVYIATCSKGVAPTISYDTVSAVGSRTIYVDGGYVGVDSDGSISKPFTTISDAINDAGGSPAKFVISGGDYRETLPLANLRDGYHQFIGKQTEKIRVLGSDKLEGWTLNSGNVYQTAYTGTIRNFPRLGGQLLFEDGNPSKEITDKPHPLQRNLTHRLPFTPIYPRNTIAEVEAEPGTYYHDGSNIYLHPNGSGNPNSNGFSYEVIVRSPNTAPNINTQTEVVDIFMQNMQFMFMIRGVLFEGFNTVKRLNCTAMAADGAGAFINDTGYVEAWFEEAAFCNNDGENNHFNAYSGFNTDTDNRVNYPNAIYYYLWSHDNGDDGESSHENHNIVMVGALLEWNGDSGSRPSNDATYNYSHCHARKNGWEVSNFWQATVFTGGEGFAVVNPTINPNRVGCRAYLSNCVSEENCVGYGTISQSANYIEVVDSISRNNTFAEFYAGAGTLVSRNNRATNADSSKLKVTAGAGVIEVLNDDLLI